MSIFIDTSALYAILDADDENHESAKRAWTELVEHEERLVCSNYVLVETFALVQHRLGMEAVRLVAGLLEAAGAQVEAVHINELRDETFIGSVYLRANGQTEQIDVRPSDALALAFCVNAPIFVYENVLEQAGTDSPTDVHREDRAYTEVARIRPLELPEWVQGHACEPGSK